MLPTPIREALLRMATSHPSTEHRQYFKESNRHKHGKDGSAFGTKGRYAAKITTAVLLPGSSVYKPRSMKEASRARRRTGKRGE